MHSWGKNGERLRERKKCMPCVVARIYIVGSLVVVKRGVRVRRNCNIFNLAMENVLKGLPDKISCPDIIHKCTSKMYTFFNRFQIARSWRWNRFQWWKKPEYPESKLYHLRLRVECTLFVINKAGREPTPYWWYRDMMLCMYSILYITITIFFYESSVFFPELSLNIYIHSFILMFHVCFTSFRCVHM